MTHYCDKCNEDHLISEFYLLNNKSKLSDGTIKAYPVYRCKKITNAEQKIYAEKNREKILKNNKEYYEKNKEKHAEKSKEYREKNATEIKKSKKEYYAKNVDDIKVRKLAKKQTIEGTLKNLVNKRIEYNKERGQPCDLDVEYIELLLKKQNSKCIYCNHDLEIMFKSNKLQQISIDRIDSSKLYSKDNINISCLFCNLAKNDMDESMYKTFIGTLRGDKYNIENTKLANIIDKTVHACRYSDKKKKLNLENTITLTQAKELLKKQNNKCAISGIQLINTEERSFPYKMSIDRIDNSKGHTLENCQILCLAIQRGKLDKTNEETIQYVREIMQS